MKRALKGFGVLQNGWRIYLAIPTSEFLEQKKKYRFFFLGGIGTGFVCTMLKVLLINISDPVNLICSFVRDCSLLLRFAISFLIFLDSLPVFSLVSPLVPLLLALLLSYLSCRSVCLGYFHSLQLRSQIFALVHYSTLLSPVSYGVRFPSGC